MSYSDASRLRLDESQHIGHPRSVRRTASGPFDGPSLGSNTHDITEAFTEASGALGTGSLVKDDFFTLYEAVGAVEIMDPKMDSGYLGPGETLEYDYDVLRDLLPEEVIGIIDQILFFEMAWHQGYPLSQTVFTSVYIDRLLSPEPRTFNDANFFRHTKLGKVDNPYVHIVLRAYCIGTLKCCDHVLRTMSTEHYYEEEDFSTHTFNRSMLSLFEADNVIACLDDAINWLATQDSNGNALIQHISTRLTFRRELLRIFSRAPQEEPQEPQQWDYIEKLIDRVKSSAAAGRQVKEAFSEKIQRRLASTAPPKPVIEISGEEAFQKLKDVISDLREAHRVLHIDSLNSPANLRHFIWSFASRKPPPLAYPRICLQALLFAEGGVASDGLMQHLLRSDFQELTMEGNNLLSPSNWDIELPSDPRHQVARRIDAFILRCIQVGRQEPMGPRMLGDGYQDYLDLYRSLCQNRCRIRRTLCHVMQAFEYLQLEAETIDVELQELVKEAPLNHPDLGERPVHSMPLSSWTYYHKLQQMEWIVQLGFEQDIYQHDELGGMYWLLELFVADRISHLGRISPFLKRTHGEALLKGHTGRAAVVKRAMDHNSALVEEAAGIYYLAKALAIVFTTLNALSLIRVPPRPFSSSNLRYELRMKPFLGLSMPQLPSYEEFESRTNPILNSPKDIPHQLDAADNAIREAKRHFSAVQKRDADVVRIVGVEDYWYKKWIQPCLLSCIAAGLAVATLKKAQNAHSTSKIADFTSLLDVKIPSNEERYHEWWIVPKISESK